MFIDGGQPFDMGTHREVLGALATAGCHAAIEIFILEQAHHSMRQARHVAPIDDEAG
jgi:hypothetical protein